MTYDFLNFPQFPLILKSLGYPPFPEDVAAIINNKYHFARNSDFVQIVKPVINSIGRMECRDASLGDVFGELIIMFAQIRGIEVLCLFTYSYKYII